MASRPKQLMRTALVTGGARLKGIGFNIAKNLLTATRLGTGAVQVCFSSTHSERIALPRDILREHALSTRDDRFVVGHELDLTSTKSTMQFIERLPADYKTIDLWINNAAVCDIGWDKKVLSRALRIHFLAPLQMLSAASPLVSGRTMVMNITCEAGSLSHLAPDIRKILEDPALTIDTLTNLAREAEANPEKTRKWAAGSVPAYSFSKALLNGWTRVLARNHVENPRVAPCAVAVDPGPASTYLTRFKEKRTPDRAGDLPASVGLAYLKLLATPDAPVPFNGKLMRDGKEASW